MTQVRRSVRGASVLQPTHIGRLIPVDMSGNSNVPESVQIAVTVEKAIAPESDDAGLEAALGHVSAYPGQSSLGVVGKLGEKQGR